MNSTKVKPQFVVIELDRSENYSEELVKRAGGKIYDIFLYDETEHTYCAETTPSYFLIYLHSNPERSEDDVLGDLLWEDIEEANSGESQDIYIHVSKIDAIPKSQKHYADSSKITPDQFADDDSYNDLVEHFREYYTANHAF